MRLRPAQHERPPDAQAGAGAGKWAGHARKLKEARGERGWRERAHTKACGASCRASSHRRRLLSLALASFLSLSFSLPMHPHAARTPCGRPPSPCVASLSLLAAHAPASSLPGSAFWYVFLRFSLPLRLLLAVCFPDRLLSVSISACGGAMPARGRQCWAVWLGEYGIPLGYL